MSLIDVRAVHTARHGLGILGHRFRVTWVARIEHNDPVLAVRRALPGEHAVLSVLCCHDIVHDARIRHHGVDDLGMRDIRDVDRIDAIGDGRQVGARA